MDWGLLYILTLSIIEVFGDFQLRFYAQTNNTTHLGLGILGYVGVLYFLIQSLRFENVLYTNALWDGMSGLIGSVAAYFILGDRLKTFEQYIGVIFIIVGIVLLKV